ncbi:MAG: glycine--tRNA ligase [Planctomycetota bacterium]|nr:glycine--tRNA ligase [Planctomycetota bacterium]
MTKEGKIGDLMDKIVSLCKRRGFIFQSSEIYGGINGFWDYGPLGVELKRNLKNIWWEDVVRRRDDIVGLDAAIIMNPKVWEASGHVVGFSDPMVDCKGCKARFRADQFDRYHLLPTDVIPEKVESIHDQWERFKDVQAAATFIAESGKEISALQTLVRRALGSKRAKLQTVPCADGRTVEVFVADGNKNYYLNPTQVEEILSKADLCPNCGGELTEARKFNLMFKTFIGAMDDSSSQAYLRPETAQGIFANYMNVLDTSRVKLPFGIAQIGKAFRNEINPRNFTFRSREFEQMEIEFFCRPAEADKWYEYWRDARYKWYIDLGLTSNRLRLRNHEKNELAHYAASCADIEYDFPFGISELEGVANRTDFDLSQHQKFSGRDMTYFDDATRERFIPYVIEPSGGVDRAVLAFICEAYTEDEAPDDKGNMQKRVVMKFHPRLAPIKAAVFPLVKKEGMPEIARKIYDDVQASGLACFYDDKGAIGRRYRRQDEAGTPFCITVDGQSLEDRTVTIRQRDSLKQDRIDADEVVQYVRERIG